MGLLFFSGEYAASNDLLAECYSHAQDVEKQGNVLRIRSRNHFLQNNFTEAMKDTLVALRLLGVELSATPTQREANAMFEMVKNEILAIGFDSILAIPRTTDPRMELAVSLLNDAGLSFFITVMSKGGSNNFFEGMSAYFSAPASTFADVIGLTVCNFTFIGRSAKLLPDDTTGIAVKNNPVPHSLSTIDCINYAGMVWHLALPLAFSGPLEVL